MPYQKVDGTTVVISDIIDTTDYVYNLDYTPSGTQAHGLSVQAVVENTSEDIRTFISGIASSGSATVVDYTALAGDSLIINGISVTEGIDWTAATSNAATAASLRTGVHTKIPNVVSIDPAFATLSIFGTNLFTAVTVGTAGNSITITLLADHATGPVTVTVVGTDITFHVDDGSMSTANTVQQLVDASNGDVSASALVTASVIMNPTDHIGPNPQTPLSGGTGSTDVVAMEWAIRGTVGNVTLSSTDPAHLSVSGTHFTGGVDPQLDPTANTITISTHGYVTGLGGELSTDDTLPSPFVAATEYYVIVVDANTIKLASSLVNAEDGVAIDITDYGNGTQTLTPDTFSIQITFQSSNDKEDWSNIGSTFPFTSSDNTLVDLGVPNFHYIRAHIVPISGDSTITLIFNAINN